MEWKWPSCCWLHLLSKTLPLPPLLLSVWTGSEDSCCSQDVKAVPALESSPLNPHVWATKTKHQMLLEWQPTIPFWFCFPWIKSTVIPVVFLTIKSTNSYFRDNLYGIKVFTISDFLPMMNGLVMLSEIFGMCNRPSKRKGDSKCQFSHRYLGCTLGPWSEKVTVNANFLLVLFHTQWTVRWNGVYEALWRFVQIMLPMQKQDM